MITTLRCGVAYLELSCGSQWIQVQRYAREMLQSVTQGSNEMKKGFRTISQIVEYSEFHIDQLHCEHH